MPPKRSFDAELATLETLRDATPEAAEAGLVKALTNRNNFIVAKAATLAQNHHLASLTPALAEAFHRFLDSKSDPQCWAKIAIAKALAAFEYQSPEIFLTGMRHVQLEPVWGGVEDTAGPLRGTCALALVQCRTLNNHTLLTHLTPLFADKELSVRVNAARAVEQVGTDSASLLLRFHAELISLVPSLRAHLGSETPELFGACYSGVLSLDGPAALPWAAQFLLPEDDASAEAAMAIAQTQTPECFPILKAAAQRARDPWFRQCVLSAIALSRQQEGTAYLLHLIAEDTHAAEAQEALCRSAPSAETRARLGELGRPCS
ncbi:HEAT repeat domain-containing protein [Granulicella sibirica]|uniref:HEAT repeat protein n=1 Tax=Granulicella sibirica TaxID=2479048 RepID=A0A4Q0T3Q1_9BACT|nr:hypothetical protein [Granulicella sibirica]RXH57140.1 hypothetical protein GRAN_0450 [Granulicella sibirica]